MFLESKYQDFKNLILGGTAGGLSSRGADEAPILP